MGMYDSVVVNGEEYQVKLWDCVMETYQIGENVPEIDDSDGTYSIMLLEGGALNVFRNRIKSLTDEPRCQPVYDKWGGLWDGHNYATTW